MDTPANSAILPAYAFHLGGFTQELGQLVGKGDRIPTGVKAPRCKSAIGSLPTSLNQHPTDLTRDCWRWIDYAHLRASDVPDERDNERVMGTA